MKTFVVEIAANGLSDAEFAYRLRTGQPAVMGRLREGKVLLDLRTVFPRQEESLVQAARKATLSLIVP
jgi:L-seryl-tRNA(Ser) seleniumtransferase